MKSVNTSWPPLIVAGQIPRLVRWRDILITLTMWATFAVLVRIEFAPVLSILQAFELGDFGVKHDWPLYLEKLAPFLVVVTVLAGLLILFSLRTLWSRSRALLLPQPAPLDAADQARRAGLDEAALIAAREKRIVVVQVNESGFRIEAGAIE